MPHALTLEGVTKRFGTVTAVDDVSLQIPRGSIYGFLGQNGAGKTTTIRMIMSILYPDSGRIQVLGQDHAEAVKDRLGYLPEEKGLYKKMTTSEILTYFGRLKGMSSRDAKTKGRELLTRFGLGEWIDQRCEALSKGMGQKVQVLGTLIHEPELVILDEPFSGLDPINVEVMRDVILEMKNDGRTVIFSTHIMEQAEKICDSIFLIHKGCKVLDGSLAGGQVVGRNGHPHRLRRRRQCPAGSRRRQAPERLRQARRDLPRGGWRPPGSAGPAGRQIDDPTVRPARAVVARNLRPLSRCGRPGR